VWLDVQEVVFDPVNEAKLANHRVTIIEVLEILDLEPRFFANRRSRRASHVMVGPTMSGRILIVSIEDWGRGVWRPTTGFVASGWQIRRYRSSI
jgi:hypothetical protein